MKKYLFFLIAFINFMTSWNIAVAELTRDGTTTIPASTQVSSNTGNSLTSQTLIGSALPSGDSKPETDLPNYPLFRPHAPQYYPPKTARTALLLSATLPGLGQTYSGRPGKGLAFLAAGLGLIAAGGFNLDRAATYDDLSVRFNTGFYDPHGDAFLTAAQGRVKSRSHAQFGMLFLAGGIGVYIWNIFDAVKTVDQYNERRFPAQVQQNVESKFQYNSLFIKGGGNLLRGATYLTVNRRF